MARTDRVTSKARLLLISLCFVLAVGCDDRESEKTKAAAATAEYQAEQQLITDPARALAELRRRLRATVTFQDELIVVNSPFGMGAWAGSMPFLSLHVAPTSTPWVLSCGLGMTVTFGNSFSGEGSRVSGDVQVTLTMAAIDKSGCETLGPAVGKEIRAILAGH